MAGGAVRKRVRQYWPLLAIPPVAAALDGLLYLAGQPWTASEWASNIVFAYAVTLATVVLTRRQEKLQESSAAAELLARTAAISGNLDRLRSTAQAGAVRQVLIDARAGLHLLPYAEAGPRAEYLLTLHGAVTDISSLVAGSVRPYTWWSAAEWEAIVSAAGELRGLLELKVSDPADTGGRPYRELLRLLAELPGFVPAQRRVPLGSFERHFRHGDVSQRIRVMLDWERLREHVDVGRARVELHRHWSVQWFETHEVYSVWYARDDGDEGMRFVGYSDPGARPMPFSRVHEYFPALPAVRTTAIESMARQLEQRPQGTLPTAEIVTLLIGPKRLLVLDGNHRVAAIRYGRGDPHAMPLPVTLVEYRIIAPHDPTLLPDLTHHLPPR